MTTMPKTLLTIAIEQIEPELDGRTLFAQTYC